MSILSQIGVLILIGCIVFILIRSNKTLKEASEEGEHFVDEWALRQQRKEERLLEKEERRQEKAERRLSQKRKQEDRKKMYEAEDDPDDGERADYDGEVWYHGEEQDTRYRKEESADFNEEVWYHGEEQDIPEQETGRDNSKIVFMDRYRGPGITLLQLDEGHRPVSRIRVTKLPFTIGRSQENMLVLDDLCVARKHCRIVEEDGAFVLEDVGTANRLFFNGTVTDRVILADQITLYIGNVEFRVEMGISRSGPTHLYQGAGERYYE